MRTRNRLERTQDPVWCQARDAVEQALEPLGFALYSEMNTYGAFGSASASYVRSDLTFELNWDGKDRWLFASFRRVKPHSSGVFGEAKAVDVPPAEANPRASTLREGELASEYIGNLVGALVAVARA